MPTLAQKYLFGQIDWDALVEDPDLYRAVAKQLRGKTLPSVIAAARRLSDRPKDTWPRGLDKRQVDALGRLIGKALGEGKHPSATARALDRLITELDPQRQRGLDRLREKFTEDGLSKEVADKRVASTEAALLRDRRRTIARTEQAYAQEAGRRLDARRRGKQWKRSISTGDDRVSEVCRRSEAQGWIPIDEPFASHQQSPPHHPRCRCSSAYRGSTPDAQAEKRAKLYAQKTKQAAAGEAAREARRRGESAVSPILDAPDPAAAFLATSTDRRTGAERNLRTHQRQRPSSSAPQSERDNWYRRETLLRQKLMDAEVREREEMVSLLAPAETWEQSGADWIPSDVPPAVRARMDEGLNFLGAMVSRDVLPPGVKPRGHVIQTGDNTRSYYVPSGPNKGVHLEASAPTHTAVHELGHFVEASNSDAARKARDFLAHRTVGEEALRLRDLVPGSSYKPDEVAKPDRFEDPYTGKIYPDGATEVISMGLQYLYNNPRKFARRDPDFFRFIVELVNGR